MAALGCHSVCCHGLGSVVDVWPLLLYLGTHATHAQIYICTDPGGCCGRVLKVRSQCSNVLNSQSHHPTAHRSLSSTFSQAAHRWKTALWIGHSVLGFPHCECYLWTPPSAPRHTPASSLYTHVFPPSYLFWRALPGCRRGVLARVRLESDVWRALCLDLMSVWRLPPVADTHSGRKPQLEHPPTEDCGTHSL